MDVSTGARIRQTLQRVVELLVAEKYAELEALSLGVRLKAENIEMGVKDYGGTLVSPPRQAFDRIDVVPIMGLQPQEYSIRFRLYTAEEGQSDLELQVTLIDDMRDGDLMRVEIDNLFVA